jgi:NADH-quinone oxidoreductase subunit J
MELLVFLVAGGACIIGALGVVLNSNPVHAALSLVGTLFGIAVLFIAQEAHFLAAVQVIVYAGAIVVLFLFVLMLLGVDRAEDLSIEPLGPGQRIAAGIVGLAVLALPLFAVWSTDGDATGAIPQAGDSNLLDPAVPNVNQLGESLFTTYLLAFEVTSVLLVIAVVGAVVLARKVKRADLIDDPLVDAHEEALAAAAESEPAESEPAEPEPAGSEPAGAEA